MPIKSLYVGNFKGVDAGGWLALKPLTVFVGPNSSGKSTWLHALACLAQTMKLPNNRRPISLDDEYAAVHLGRFIEVIHSGSYEDLISLGIEVPDVALHQLTEAAEMKPLKGDLRAQYSFRCTLRTQNTYLESATLEVGERKIDIKKSGGRRYEIKGNKLVLEPSDGFLFAPSLGHVRTRGMRLEGIIMSDLLQQIQGSIREVLQRTLYLGPFRQPPLRRYPTRGSSPVEVGAQGEATVTMLANEAVQFQTRPHIRQISKWLSQLHLAKNLEVARVGRSDLFGVDVTLDDGEKFPLADLGYGLSQVLPVLTQCTFAPKGATLLFEQPEIHLHTLAEKALAKVFAETAGRGVTIVAETHSPDLVWAIVNAVRDGHIDKKSVALYRVSRVNGHTQAEALVIEDDDDIYENWEKGISC